MKKTLQGIALLGALYGGSLHASFEFRSPLDFDARGYQHWFLAPADQAWWYGQMPTQKKNTDWNIHMWGLAYSRTANRAFFDACDPDKITRDTTSLSQLFFGKSIFRGEEAFTGGTFAGAPTETQVLVNATNPYLAFARIAPVFDYNEHGANLGIDFARYVGKNDRYHIGARVNVPFKVIEIEQDADATIQETLDDVFITRVVNTGANAQPDQVEYALRFDFLSTLVFNQTAVPSGNTTTQPVVRYDNNGTPTAGITLVGTSLTGGTASGNDNKVVDDIPSAYATKSDDGTVPAVPFRRSPNDVSGDLGADGQAANGSVSFFKIGTDYAGNLRNDRNAQGTIFVTPRSISNPGGDDDGQLTLTSATILRQLLGLTLGDLFVSEPASKFFLDRGIDLTGYQRVVGVGDAAAEIYGGICHYNDWFADGIFGIQLPTASKQEHASQIFYKPTGNNGHTVIKFGLDGGWQPREWFAFEIRPFFFHACKRVEHRGAPFEGATIVNIGPEVDVNVSWNYFTLQTDFNFFHPHNPDLGFVLGYELFAKSHDHASLANCQKTATDLLGRPDQPLAVCNYERNTNSFSNKLRGELFYRAHYFEIFGGGSQMVSGRNIMKETEAHLGLTIYF